MNRRRLSVLATILLASAALGCFAVFRWVSGGPAPIGSPTSVPEGAEWIDLLDEENAPLWRNVADDKAIFEIADGELHIFGRSIYPLRYVTFTGQEFGDFDLHLEYKLERDANSGVFLRATPDDPVVRGFEVQILDDHGKRPNNHRTGAIYDVVTPMFNLSRPAGEWNSFDISLRGHRVSVRVNGWLVIETDFEQLTEPLGKFEIAYKDLPLRGHIALQDHGGEIWFRNIRVRPVEPDPAGDSAVD